VLIYHWILDWMFCRVGKHPCLHISLDVDMCGDGRKRYYERDASELYERETKLENNRLMIQCSRWTKTEQNKYMLLSHRSW
jgi:hypothetical protein